MNVATKADGSFLKQEVETAVVIVGKGNGLTVVTAKNDMAKPSGEIYAWFACRSILV